MSFQIADPRPRRTVRKGALDFELIQRNRGAADAIRDMRSRRRRAPCRGRGRSFGAALPGPARDALPAKINESSSFFLKSADRSESDEMCVSLFASSGIITPGLSATRLHQ